jgi:hypothetical protein
MNELEVAPKIRNILGCFAAVELKCSSVLQLIWQIQEF